MSKKLLSILSFFIFSLSTPLAIAQEEDKKTANSDSNIIVGGTDFDVLKSRNKLILLSVTPEQRAFSPIEIVANQTKKEFKIEYAEFELPTRTLQKIFDSHIQNNPDAESHRGYLKLGFGNYMSPFAAVSLSNKKQSKYALSLDLRHNSSFEGAVDKQNSASSSTNLDLNSKHFFEEATLSSKLSYKHDIVHFYGYPPDLGSSINAKDIRQTFNTLGVNIDYQSNDFDADIQYQITLNSSYFINKYGAKELEINPELGAKYKLNGKNTYIGLKVGTSVANYEDETLKSKRYLAWVSPFFEKKINNLEFQLGTNLTYNNDTLYSDKQLFFYPNISANYTLLEGKMELYTSLQGEAERTLLKDLVQENPYAQSQLAVINQDKQWVATLGVKSKLGKEAFVNFNFSKGKYGHNAFWVNDSQDRSRFNLIYEDMDKTTLAFEFTWEHESFKLLFASELNQYTLENSEFAWHLPTFANTLSLNYKLKNKKLLLNLEAQHLSGIRAKDFSDDTIYILNDIIDINFSANYQFASSKWGVFVQANNLLSQTYQRYLYYNSKQINFIGGLSYSF